MNNEEKILALLEKQGTRFEKSNPSWPSKASSWPSRVSACAKLK